MGSRFCLWLQGTSYKLQVTSFKLQVTSYKLQTKACLAILNQSVCQLMVSIS
jgi:hypothetical protein